MIEVHVSRVPSLVDPPAPYVTEKYSGEKLLNFLIKSTMLSFPFSVLGGKNSKLVFMKPSHNQNQISTCRYRI